VSNVPYCLFLGWRKRTGTESSARARWKTTLETPLYLHRADTLLQERPHEVRDSQGTLELGYAMEVQWKPSSQGHPKRSSEIPEAFSDSLGLSVRDSRRLANFLFKACEAKEKGRHEAAPRITSHSFPSSSRYPHAWNLPSSCR